MVQIGRDGDGEEQPGRDGGDPRLERNPMSSKGQRLGAFGSGFWDTKGECGEDFNHTKLRCVAEPFIFERNMACRCA